MSFALIIIGITLVVAAVRDTQHCLFATVENDFRGPGNFLYWVVALMIFGAIGYSQTWRPVSEALLVLVIVALFLSKGNQGTAQGIAFFKNLGATLQGTGGSATSGSAASSAASNLLSEVSAA